MIVMQAVVEDGACIAAVPVKDTIKIADSEGYAAKTPDRKYIVADSDTTSI